MAITPFTVTPNSIESPSSFSSDMDSYLAEQNSRIVQMNALSVAGTLSEVQDTSTTSIAIGTGTKVFTVTAGKSFAAGMALLIADAAAPSTNTLQGTVTSYTGSTLTMSITSVAGSGTKTAWVISQAALAGGASVFAEPITLSPSGVASITNALSTLYKRFLITFDNMTVGTNNSFLQMDVSNNANSSYVGNFASNLFYTKAGTNTGNDNDSGLAYIAGQIISSSGGVSGHLWLTPADGTGVSAYEGSFAGLDATNYRHYFCSGVSRTTTEINYIKFAVNTGVFSGKIKIYGIL